MVRVGVANRTITPPCPHVHSLIFRDLQIFFISAFYEAFTHLLHKGEKVSGCSLNDYLKKYQNPVEVDPLLKTQNELDETKIILLDTMEALLGRGEILEDLVTKSDQLTKHSKMFYKTAKKINSCCASLS